MANTTAVLQIRVNSGAWVTGQGVQVQPGDTITFRAQSYAGWSSPAARWEFPPGAYPVGWATPAGWTLGSDGSIYYLSDPSTSMAPPSFTMPDSSDVMAGIWGKWLPRLLVNGGGDGLIDEKVGIELLSQLGFTQTGLGEEGQFDPTRQYLGGEQGNMVKLDTMLASGGGGGGLQLGGVAGQPCNANAGVVGGATTAAGANHTHQIQVGSPVAIGTANSDGNAVTLARANHVHAHGNMVGGTLHAVASGGANGFMSAADFVKLQGIESGAQVCSYAHILTACAGGGAPLALNTQRLTGLANATGPTDAVTLAQVQAIANGFDLKPEARGASLANQALSGALTEDGITYADNDRYLAKNQTDQTQNGLYVVNTTGTWARAPDADTSAEVTPGMFVFVLEGTQNSKTGWALLTPGPITLGSSNLVFTQIFGPGSVVAGNGLSRSGNTLSLNLGDSSLVFASGAVKVGVISDVQHGSRGNGTLHAVADSTHAGFIPAADWVAINGRSASPVANAVVLFGSSAELTATAFVADGGTPAATVGILRAQNNVLIVGAADSGGNDAELLKLDNSNKLIVGDTNRVANADLLLKTGGALNVKVNGAAVFTAAASNHDAHSKRIASVADPAAGGDATNKGYVDTRTGFAYLNLIYSDVVADGTGLSTMFINIDGGSGGSGHVNNGSSGTPPAGAVALGVRWQLNIQFAAAGATLIKMSVGIASSFKQLINVHIDATSPATGIAYASFSNDDCGGDVSGHFQVKIEIQGGPDFTALTAGDLVLRCFYVVATQV